MYPNRKKIASEWFARNVYSDEQIQPHPAQSYESVPEEIRSMRQLESGANFWRCSREEIFVKQGQQMADYEDDYPYKRDVVRYYPTYQALSDRELRGYFTWRTKWRRGEEERTSLSFAFLYIYELLNQIGVKNPIEGYELLRAFYRDYGALDDSICSYLSRWLWDYVVYYQLDPVLLEGRKELQFDRHLAALIDVDTCSNAEIFNAVVELSSYRLDRSKLFAQRPEMLEKVTATVLRKIDKHYSTHRKQSLTEDYFGPIILVPVDLFMGAVFYKQTKHESFDYEIDALRSYQNHNGKWTCRFPDAFIGRSKKLGDVMRTVDSMLREASGVGNSIQPGLSTKWLLKLIEESIQEYQQEKKAEEARRITIDFSKLSGIRHDASVTREKLIVDEERDENPIPEIAEEPKTPLPAMLKTTEENAFGLDENEKRLLHSLLYGEDLTWIHEEGLMSTVLVDSINEKLYDCFGDTVLVDDSSPTIIEDYTKELKEMLKL